MQVRTFADDALNADETSKVRGEETARVDAVGANAAQHKHRHCVRVPSHAVEGGEDHLPMMPTRSSRPLERYFESRLRTTSSSASSSAGRAVAGSLRVLSARPGSKERRWPASI